MKHIKQYRWILIVILVLLFIGRYSMNMKKAKDQTNENFTTCKKAVETYLSTTNKEIKPLQAKKGNNVVVDYIGRFESGEVFDTSVEEVAKQCGVYQTGRDYSKHLPFTVGAGQMIAGFDSAVDGMKLGATTTITLAPKDAYGEKNEKLIVTLEKSKIQNPERYKEGDTMMDSMGREIQITKVTDTEITFDGNPRMAGKTLIFDITLLEIK